MIELDTLKKKIESLNKNQHVEILKILNKRNISYSENKNGIFFNLSTLKDDDIEEIKQFMSYIADQEVSLSSVETVKQDFKKTFFDNTIKENSIDNISHVQS